MLSRGKWEGRQQCDHWDHAAAKGKGFFVTYLKQYWPPWGLGHEALLQGSPWLYTTENCKKNRHWFHNKKRKCLFQKYGGKASPCKKVYRLLRSPLQEASTASGIEPKKPLLLSAAAQSWWSHCWSLCPSTPGILAFDKLLESLGNHWFKG